MNLRPDRDQRVVQWLQKDRALVLQEVNVEQGLFVVDVPMRMTCLQCQQHIWIREYWILVCLKDRVARIMPLAINDTDPAMITADLGRGK